MNFTLTLPERVRESQVAIATQQLQVNVGVSVTGSPDTVIAHMGPLPFIGVGGNMPTLYTTSGAIFTLSLINGRVYSEQPVLGVLTGISGGVVNGSFGRRQTDAVTAQFPEVSNGNVTAAGVLANIALEPGRYDNVSATLFGRVRLRTGKYYFTSLTATSTGTIQIDASAGPVEIFVTNGLSLAGTVTGDASKIMIAYSGTAPAYVAGNFNGAVIAPNATLTMAGGLFTLIRGQFYAQGVVLAPAVRVAHVPSQVFGPTRIARALVAPASTPILGYDPGYFGCAPSINLPGSIQTQPGGRQYFQDLSYPANPTACQQSILSCDENGNVIPRPTVAQLNAQPAPGSECGSLGAAVSVAECAIDPSSVTTLCSAGCAAGEVCGTICLDAACTNSEARCGRLYASCAPLPVATNCETYYQCENTGTKGISISAGVLAANPPKSEPGPDAVPDEEIAVTRHALIEEACESYGVLGDSLVSEFGGAPREEGTDKWGVWFAPATTLQLGKTDLGRSRANGKFAVVAMGGVGIKARMMGEEVDVFDVQFGADITECGFRFITQSMLFGESIASWDPDDGPSVGLSNLGPDLDTPWLQKQSCGGVYEARKEQAGALRHSAFVGRAVAAHYELYGATEEMCAAANDMLNGGFDCDMPPYNEDQSLTIVEEWRQHYHRNVEDYLEVDGEWDDAAEAIGGSGVLRLFDIRQAYSLGAAEATIPLGPINLVLAVEAFGFWEIHGSIAGHLSYGIGYGDFWNSSGSTLGLEVGQPTLPSAVLDHDLRATAGPVFAPGIGVTALAYVGAGVGPLSVGIEGQVDVIRLTLPAALMATLGRVSVPNVRGVTGDWDGDPIAGMDIDKGMDWRTNITGKVGIGLDVLDGRINLAARINLWFWSKTWRIKFADFTGYNIYIPLLETSLGDPVVSASTYGVEADNVEYTVIAPQDTFVPGIVPAPPLPIPFNQLDCVSVD